MRNTGLIGTILSDVHFSFRSLTRNPGFTSAAVLCIGLGMAISIAVFTLVRSQLLRPLPYPHPDQLLSITQPSVKFPNGVTLTPEYAAWQLECRSLKLAAWNDDAFNLTGANEPEQVSGAEVNAAFLDVLGVSVLLGRNFTLADDQLVKNRVTLLTYQLWNRQFNKDPRCIGRTVLLNEKPYEIIGILPETFHFPGYYRPDLLVPGGYSTPPNWGANTMGLLTVIGRLEQGRSVDQAIAELNTVQQNQGQYVPSELGNRFRDRSHTFGERSLLVVPLSTHLSGNVRKPLIILMAAVLVVLLIGCVNVAGLQIARTMSRRHELAIRSALGAGRLMLISLILSENIIISFSGALIGAIGAGFLVEWIPKIAASLVNFADGMRFADDIRMDSTVLVFAVSAAIVSALVCGLASAFAVHRQNPNDILRSGGKPMVKSYAGKLRHTLIVGQIAIAFMLLVAAGLLLRSYIKVAIINSGIQADNVLTFKFRLPKPRYDDSGRLLITRNLVQQIEALPGVKSAAIATALPFAGVSNSVTFEIEGKTPDQVRPTAPLVFVSPTYFAALGIPVLAGDGFRETADPGFRTAVINSSFAHRYFPQENPVGKRLRRATNSNEQWVTIMGVVGDVRYKGPEQAPEPMMFFRYDQYPQGGIGIAIRSSVPDETLTNSVRNIIRGIDRDIPIFDVLSLETRLARLNSARHFQAWLTGAFAIFAIILVGLGMYGLIAYTVSQNKMEIGLRMALGAESTQVRNLFLWRSTLLCLLGLGIGAFASIWIVRYLRSVLFEVSIADPFTYIAVVCLLLSIGLLAGYLPAKKAAAMDPNVVLRSE